MLSSLLLLGLPGAASSAAISSSIPSASIASPFFIMAPTGAAISQISQGWSGWGWLSEQWRQSLQTQRWHFLQWWNWLVSLMQKWHSLSSSKAVHLRGCWQQQVSRRMGRHWKQNICWSSSSQQPHRHLMIFSLWHPPHSTQWSSFPFMYIMTWFAWHFLMTGRSLSPLTDLQYSKQSQQSLVLQCWSYLYSQQPCPHRMQPQLTCSPAWAGVRSSCQCSRMQLSSPWMSRILQLRQYLLWQLGHCLGHSLSLRHREHTSTEWQWGWQASRWEQEQWVLTLAMSYLGRDWSNLSGSSLWQASQMPRLHMASSQTPSLLTAVLTPHMSQMKLRLAMRWKLKECPMGQPSLEQGSTRHPTQYSSPHCRQIDRQSFSSPHSAQGDSSISSQEPMKNSSWWPLRHLYSLRTCMRQSSSSGTYWQWRQWLSKSCSEWMPSWQAEGSQGQKKSSCRAGSGSTRKGALHLKGHLSTFCRVSETHFMQKMWAQGPRQRTGFMHTSQQIPHSYRSRIYCDLRKLRAVITSFFMLQKILNSQPFIISISPPRSSPSPFNPKYPFSSEPPSRTTLRLLPCLSQLKLPQNGKIYGWSAVLTAFVQAGGQKGPQWPRFCLLTGEECGQLLRGALIKESLRRKNAKTEEALARQSHKCTLCVGWSRQG